MARYNFEKRTYAIAPQGIVELFVDARHMPINAQPYGGDELCIEYYASEEYPYSVHVENGIVILDCPQASRRMGLGDMFNIFSIPLGGTNWQNLTINIYVPRAYAGMLNLCTSNAAINVRNLELAGRLHALTSNAAVDVRGVIAAAFEFGTTNARVYAENAAACGEPDDDGMLRPAENKISSTNGAIELRGFSTLGSLSCHTTNGGMRLSDTAIQGALSCATSNGSVRIESVSAQETAWIKSSNASVKLDRLLARDIDISTTNGNIKGSIVGAQSDFMTDCSTTNGKCRPASGGLPTGRMLRARTTNANIVMEFV